MLGERLSASTHPRTLKQLDKLVTSLCFIVLLDKQVRRYLCCFLRTNLSGGLFFSKTTNSVINEYFKALKVSEPLKAGRGEGQGPKKGKEAAVTIADTKLGQVCPAPREALP